MARRYGISTKLLVWTLLLVVVFCATSGWLIVRVSRNAELAEELVSRNHEIGVAARRMSERLESVQENIRRYSLLGADDATRFIVEDINTFGDILNAVLEKHPEMVGPWAPLSEEFSISIDPEAPADAALEGNPTIREWQGILRRTLEENRLEMQAHLRELEESGRMAVLAGFWGLMACLALGIGGSLLWAWRLNRSLSELRRGIREVRTGGLQTPVRVASRDEFGELGEAFNRMGTRLRAEEHMRAEFVSMLSHEIRTPLTSIRESMSMLEQGVFGEVNEKQRQFLSLSMAEAVRLTDLLERLMTVSRLESGQLDVSPEAADAGQLVRDVADSLLPAAEHAGITLDMEINEPARPVRADAERIRQVLLNLGGNAIKFSPKGARVVLAVQPSNGGAEFSVSDDGPGIAEAEQQLVFDKYYRAGSVRQEKDGAGLGLAICRRIVEAHGSTLGLESEVGAGSRFSFVLPPALNEKD